MPREGSLALACFGKVRKVQLPAPCVAFAPAVALGRKSVALKQILEAALESPGARFLDAVLAIAFTPTDGLSE
jgi:hypothetical protein